MTAAIRRLAVFCGSADGTDPGMAEAAYQVGRGLALRGVGLVYGGGGRGLMGAVSQGSLDAGGDVVGVMPRFMVNREWGRDDLDQLYVVESMHDRKALMADKADAFLALPGGLGTLEEIFEAWSWRQINFIDDPVGLLNVNGFWDRLLSSLQDLVDAGFMRADVLEDIVVADTLDTALDGLAARLGTRLPDKSAAPSS